MDGSCGRRPGVVWTKVDNSWKDAGGTNKVLDKLSESSANGTGELKAAFKNRITGTSYDFFQIYNAGATGDSTYVCFKPKSNAFKTEALTRCTDTSKPSDFPPSACGATWSDDFICPSLTKYLLWFFLFKITLCSSVIYFHFSWVWFLVLL